MVDALRIWGFALPTAFALSVDVGLYAIVRFATSARPQHAVRFGIEVGVAHAVLLAAGALLADGLGHAIGSDFLVDVVATLALLVVLAGAVRRARDPSLEGEPIADPSRAVSWFTAFALSIDAFLIGPAADDFLTAASVAERVAVLGSILLGVSVFAFGYASFAKTLRSQLASRHDLGSNLAYQIAGALEIVVFSVFTTDAALRALEHVHPAFVFAWPASRSLGVLLGVALFAFARLTRSPRQELGT